MTGIDKAKCSEIIKHGIIKDTYDFKLGEDYKTQYIVECMGDTYYMTLTNGEWTYLYKKEDK